MTGTPRARIFVSCGQNDDWHEDLLPGQIEDAIEAESFGGLQFEAYVASRSQAFTKVTSGVFPRIDRFEYFLFVDFRREEIQPRPGSKATDRRYRGSLFVNQELAIACFLANQLPFPQLLAFREKGVEDRGGLLRYAQGNVTLHEFAPAERGDLPKKIVQAIHELVRSGDWKPDWRKELSLSLVTGPPDDAMFQGKFKTRYFHVAVTNLSWKTDATNCRAYLREWRRIAASGTPMEDAHVPPPCELKWDGITEPSVVVSTGVESSRGFDALFVHHDHPSVAFIGLNPFIVDSSKLRDTYRIEGTGDYELVYTVRSAEFEPSEITLTLHLGLDIGDARIEHGPSKRMTPLSSIPATEAAPRGSTSSGSLGYYIQAGTIEPWSGPGSGWPESGVAPMHRG